MKSFKVITLAAIFTLSAATTTATTELTEHFSPFLSAPPPSSPFITLGGACPFAVLGGSAVTGAASVEVDGDVGVSPGKLITTFPLSVDVSGYYHYGNTAAAAAHTDLNYAILQAKEQTPGENNTLSSGGVDIGGRTLKPGVYKIGTGLHITGTLKLDAQNDTDASWIFQIGTTFVIEASSKVEIINAPEGGMSGDHVWWQVGSGATLGATSTVIGAIMATSSITTGAGSISGPLLANLGPVTLGAGAIVGIVGGCTIDKPEPARLIQDTFIIMGDACTFAVLGASAVTGAALVEVGGDVGVSPGTLISTFPPGTNVTGSFYPGDNTANAAHMDLEYAIFQAKDRATGQNKTLSASAIDVGGMTLNNGVYKVGTALSISSSGLKLDARGDADAAWIFQIGTTLITAINAKVEIINAPEGGMNGNHIWWQVGTSATIGATSTVLGSIMATTSITTGVDSITGPLLASVGLVTLGAGAIVNVDNKCAVTK